MEEGEIKSFIKVWLTVLTSLCYCHAIGKRIEKGKKRFICIIPVVTLFLYLPINLRSPHFGGFTAFFIAWLANFKLLLFAFGRGPLCSTAKSNLSLPLYLTIACLPIKIQRSKTHQNPTVRKSREGPVNYAVKILLLGIIVRTHEYLEYLHPKMVMVLYLMYIYFMLEIILAMGAAMVRTVSGLDLEPQFNEPYFSTSLQDFWGKRWNLMVTSILRPTVYEPALGLFSNLVGRKWAPLPSVFSTFMASAIMHELMFYYLGRLYPNGEVTLFFLIHGLCLTVEIAVKKALDGKWRLPWIVTGPLTAGFVLGTAFWLFIPQFTRCKADVRAFEEYAEVSALLKKVSQKVQQIFIGPI